MGVPKTSDPDCDASLSGRSREELEFWLRGIGAPLVLVGKQTLTVRQVNRNAALFFGLDPDGFAGCPISDLVGPEAAGMLGQIWSNFPVGIPGEPFLVRAQVQAQERLLMVQVTKLLVEGELLRLFTFADAPPQGSVALAGWQENIIAMLNWLPFGFEIASIDDQIQFANSQFNEMFGYSQSDIEDIEDWWQLVYPDPEYRRFARWMWETAIEEARAENREMTPFDLDVTTASGARRTIQFRHRTIGSFNVNLYLDVTRERAYARQLKVLAETDPLTGIMNRRRFFEEAEHIYRDLRPSSRPAVLMLDVDHFKRVNDEFGHAFGDRVLQEFSRRCSSVIGEGDLFSRLGGEEFAVLLNDAPEAEVRWIGERIRSEISNKPFVFDGEGLDVTVSVGGAFRLADETTVELTLSRADRALYQAKNSGRDRVIFLP